MELINKGSIAKRGSIIDKQIAAFDGLLIGNPADVVEGLPPGVLKVLPSCEWLKGSSPRIKQRICAELATSLSRPKLPDPVLPIPNDPDAPLGHVLNGLDQGQHLPAAHIFLPGKCDLEPQRPHVVLLQRGDVKGGSDLRREVEDEVDQRDVEVRHQAALLELIEVHRGDEEFEGLGAFELARDEELVEFVKGLEAEQVSVVHVLGLEGDVGYGALCYGQAETEDRQHQGPLVHFTVINTISVLPQYNPEPSQSFPSFPLEAQPGHSPASSVIFFGL